MCPAIISVAKMIYQGWQPLKQGYPMCWLVKRLTVGKVVGPCYRIQGKSGATWARKEKPGLWLHPRSTKLQRIRVFQSIRNTSRRQWHCRWYVRAEAAPNGSACFGPRLHVRIASRAVGAVLAYYCGMTFLASLIRFCWSGSYLDCRPCRD